MDILSNISHCLSTHTVCWFIIHSINHPHLKYTSPPQHMTTVTHHPQLTCDQPHCLCNYTGRTEGHTVGCQLERRGVSTGTPHSQWWGHSHKCKVHSDHSGHPPLGVGRYTHLRMSIGVYFSDNLQDKTCLILNFDQLDTLININYLHVDDDCTLWILDRIWCGV